MRRLTTEEFISRAQEVHGDKSYDYSHTEYKTQKIKVGIICPKHGMFYQNPSGHMLGAGCPDCSGNRRDTRDTFIAKARKVHGKTYSYVKVHYKRSQVKVEIVCPEHGSFMQVPAAHLTGQGCARCYGNAKKTTEEFIRDARKAHRDRFDYSKVEYQNAFEKVTIICRVHGQFYQTPDAHMNNAGCMACRREDLSRRFTLTTHEFLCKAHNVHGSRYGYQKSNYISAKTKVAIECELHGEFQQRPDKHLRGQGCPDCGREKGGFLSTEQLEDPAFTGSDNYVYWMNLVSESGERFSKIGISDDPARRSRQIERDSECSVKVKATSRLMPSRSSIVLEKILLRSSMVEPYTPAVTFLGRTECVQVLDSKALKDFFGRI